MKYCKILNFNEQFLKNDLFIDTKNINEWYTLKINHENFLTQNAIDYIKNLNLNLKISHSNLFIGPPYSKTSVHIDNFSKNIALNYVWGSENSFMNWYDIINFKISVNKTHTNTNYFTFNENDVKKVETCNLYKKLSFININKPHSVENFTNSTRFCISIRFQNCDWTSILDKMKNFILF